MEIVLVDRQTFTCKKCPNFKSFTLSPYLPQPIHIITFCQYQTTDMIENGVGVYVTEITVISVSTGKRYKTKIMVIKQFLNMTI